MTIKSMELTEIENMNVGNPQNCMEKMEYPIGNSDTYGVNL